MTKPKRANDTCLPAHWKVRICIRGCAVLHFASKDEPVVNFRNEKPIGILWRPIMSTEAGDTPAYIDWDEVSAITWRFAPLVTIERE